MVSAPTSPLRRIVLSFDLSTHTIILRSGKLSLLYRRSEESTPSGAKISTLYMEGVFIRERGTILALSFLPAARTSARRDRRHTKDYPAQGPTADTTVLSTHT